MATKKLQCVKVEKKNGITWVMLNRPEKRNAMSPQLHFEMDETLKELETDPATKVVVVCGAGGYFSAGQDLKEFFRANENNPAGRKAAAEAANRWRWERLYKYDKPTIAMVEGFCVGGAFMQLCATDFAVCADDTVFSLSEVNWGILPGALVSKVVSDTIMPRKALYYCCLGEPFNGKEAEDIGFVNFSVPQSELVNKTIELAQKLMAKSPAVLRATKHAVRQVRSMDFDQSYDYLAAKGQAIKVGDTEDSYNTGLTQFLDQKAYKPTFEPFALKDGKKPAAKKKAPAKKAAAKKVTAKKTVAKKKAPAPKKK